MQVTHTAFSRSLHAWSSGMDMVHFCKKKKRGSEVTEAQVQVQSKRRFLVRVVGCLNGLRRKLVGSSLLEMLKPDRQAVLSG